MNLLDDLETLREPVRDACRRVLRARLECAARDSIGDDTLRDCVRNMADDLLQAIDEGGYKVPLWWVEVAAPFAHDVPEVAERLAFLNATTDTYTPASADEAEIIDEYRSLVRPKLL